MTERHTEIRLDESRPTEERHYGAKECARCQSRFSNDARFCPFDGEPLVPAVGVVPRDPLVGTLIDDRYEVQSVLGEGGMGTVYRVRHSILERPFALKVLRADLARDADLGERFLREARAAACISHPSVVQITDFGSLPTGQAYFVMELLGGESLSAVVRRGGPLPAGRAVRLLRDMIGALSAAHEAGVIHRDLKPDNVLVCPTQSGETVKLLDFGLAKVAGQSRLTKAGVVFGTPHYMSPEQAMGGTVDERTDLYALGVVMYEMFTGRVPFEADTYMGVLTKHLYVEPTPPSVLLGGMTTLGALELVVLRCLEKKPERRYASMSELGDELERIAKFDAAGVFSVEPAKPAARRSPRLADELELPSQIEMRVMMARSGLGRRTAPALIGALLAIVVASLLAVSWAVFHRRNSVRGPRLAIPVLAVEKVAASAHSDEPSPAVVVTPSREPVPPEPPVPAPSASPKAERAHSVGKPPPHMKRPRVGASGEPPNNPIQQGKVQDNGIINPWNR